MLSERVSAGFGRLSAVTADILLPKLQLSANKKTTEVSLLYPICHPSRLKSKLAEVKKTKDIEKRFAWPDSFHGKQSTQGAFSDIQRGRSRHTSETDKLKDNVNIRIPKCRF